MMAKETEEQFEARMKAAEKQLAQDVQDKLNKDGDVDERDRRLEAAGRLRRTEPASKAPAKKAPIVTKEQLAKSGLSLRDYMNKQRGLTRRDGTAPAGKASAPSAKGAMIQSMDTDMMRTAGRTAAKEQGAKYAAERKKSANQAAFERAQAEAKTPEGKTKREAQIKGQALERVTPEEYLVGGGGGAGLKALHKAAKNLATPKVREYSPTMLPAPKAATTAAAKSETKSLPAPQQKLSYDKRSIKDKERSDRAAAREKQKDIDNIQRGGRLTGGRDIELKKGGSVRGAGIAQRGFRKCKIV